MVEGGSGDTENAPLGACPDCNMTITSASLLITYESGDGWPRRFAECPRCGVPVHPE